MSLSLRAVSYCYDRVPPAVTALTRVDFDIEPGELVLVLGTTGSGKSTLLRVAGGLLKATSGDVTIDGRSLERSDVGVGVGLIFQDAESQLFADTILDDVAFGPANGGLARPEAEQRAREALAAVGLPVEEYGERSPFTLSGGEARRAAIAGVMAMRPRYLLADEPTAGLDAGGRRAVRELLLQAREWGGVLVVSHSSEEFLPHADRVLVLRDGELGWFGPAVELIDDPRPLVAAGLTTPTILDVQLRMRGRVGGLEHLTLDPVSAARSLAEARGRCT